MSLKLGKLVALSLCCTTLLLQANMSFEKPKSKLFRPDPYYIPGYCGYCPMQKYQLGETYGKTTANILTDPSVSKY